MLTVTRYHDFSCAHRAVGDPGKCSRIHGHNYRVHFYVSQQIVHPATLSNSGRVLDFSVIKETLCQWLEDNWDHKLLLWRDDPLITEWKMLKLTNTWATVLDDSIEVVPFNTSTELMAVYLVKLGKHLLPDGVVLRKVIIEETRKCGAQADHFDAKDYS